jgi:hypothetical protein
MDIKLKPGQALVITGPQGSGKTKLAREIASGFGLCSVFWARGFRDPFYGANVFAENLAAAVVEQTTREDLESAHIKHLISNPTMAIIRKNRELEFVKTPRFIFCMRDDEQWSPGADDRRYKVVRLGKAPAETQPAQAVPTGAERVRHPAVDAAFDALSVAYQDLVLVRFKHERLKRIAKRKGRDELARVHSAVARVAVKTLEALQPVDEALTSAVSSECLDRHINKGCPF